MRENFTNEDVEALVDRICGGNKEDFGRILGVSGTTVARWIKGKSTPPRGKVDIMQAVKDALEKERGEPRRVMRNVIARRYVGDNDLHTTEPDSPEVVKDQTCSYSEVMGQSKPYSRAQCTMLEAALEVYKGLTPEQRRQVDIAFITAVAAAELDRMGEHASNKEGGLDDD